jgi:hypothetical protein
VKILCEAHSFLPFLVKALQHGTKNSVLIWKTLLGDNNNIDTGMKCIIRSLDANDVTYMHLPSSVEKVKVIVLRVNKNDSIRRDKDIPQRNIRVTQSQNV